jgi:hypothetical protein
MLDAITSLKLRQDKTERKVAGLEKDIGDVSKQVKELTEQINKQEHFPPLQGRDNKIAGASDRASAETLIKSVSTNVSERLQRQKNIVIFGLADSNNILKEEVKVEDNQTVKDIYQTVTDKELVENTDFEATRLGKKPEGEQVSKRPLLVKFIDSAHKSVFMKNLRKLKDSPYKISIREDMSKEDREVERALREEAKAKNETVDPHWIHVVKGEPWNRRVVKVKKKTNEGNPE